MPTEQELIEEGKRIEEELGRAPSKKDFNNLSEDYSSKQCTHKFGTWSSFRVSADMDVLRLSERDEQGRVKKQYNPDAKNPEPRYSRKEILEEIKRLDDETDGWLSTEKFEELAEMSIGPCIDRFGSWNEARQEAGLESKPENQIAENNFNWRGGTEFNYKHGWGTKREEALRRDDYRCCLCGVTEEEHNEKFGRSLDVHHITPVRKFDNQSDAHELDNLITLCRKCHQRWEGIPLKPVIEQS
jgi:hypothetical protein